MVAIHKAGTEAGGAIGIEIVSGNIGDIIPQILEADQTAGIIISRKFYIKNNDASVDVVGDLTLEAFSPFNAIIFESTGDAQVVGDLTGSEVNESPIPLDIGFGTWKSYWLQINVPALSTETLNYQTASIKIIYQG